MCGHMYVWTHVHVYTVKLQRKTRTMVIQKASGFVGWRVYREVLRKGMGGFTC